MTNNKIALVTGASRGLGKNTALALAKKGIGVVVTYHSNLEEAKRVVSDIEATGAAAVALQLDTANPNTFDDFVVQLKQALQNKWQTEQFDFLVNNAGIGIHASFVETTEEEFDRLFNTRVKGVFFLTQKLLPQAITSQTALSRVGVPDDIGGAIAALLSEENRWITGQRIEVSGGQSL